MVTTMGLKHHIIGALSLLVLGSLPFAYTHYRYFSHNWTPLTSPVKLTAGREQTPEFTTDLNGTYDVWLAFDDHLELNRFQCLLGIDFPRNSCQGIDRSLYLSWTALRGQTILVNSESYRPGLQSTSYHEIRVQLGRFEGKKSAKQSIVLDVSGEPGELKASNPRVIVEAGQNYWEDWIIFGQLALLPAALSALIGIVWIGVALFNARRSKQVDLQPNC
jgi:hypothetical protein